MTRALTVFAAKAAAFIVICGLLFLVAINVETAWGYDTDFFRGWWSCLIMAVLWPNLVTFGRRP